MANVNSQTEFARALDHLRQGNLALAEAGLLEIVEYSPTHFDAFYLLATLNAQRANWAGAMAHLDRALAIDKRNAAANNLRGRILLDANRPDEALKCFDRAIANKRDFAQAFDNRGKALHDLHRPVEAMESFGQAIRLKPDFADACNNRGIVLNEIGRAEAALADFNAAIALDAGFAEAHSNRGNVLQFLGRQDDALASFDKAIALDPGSARAHSNRGAVLHDLHREAEAMQAFDRAIAVDSNNAEAHYNRGNLLSELRRWDEALASYSRAIQLHPAFADAYSNCGPALCELGRFDEALASVDAAIALRPNNSRARINRGIVLRHLGRLSEALESSNQAIGLAGNEPGAWSSRALILKGLERLEESLQSADKAIELHALAKGGQRDLAEAHNNRGSVLHDFNRVEEALQCYERAIALNSDFSVAHNNRGVALMDLGRLDEAVASFERAQKIKPDFTEPRYNEGICRLRAGDYERGWKKFEHRWLQPDWSGRPAGLGEKPLWQGERFDGTLLVWGEHGLGDQILFASMLPDLAGLCGNLVVRVEPRLVALFERSFPGVRFLSNLESLGDLRFDFQIPMGSIGGYCRNSSADFPSRDRGYLKAEQSLAGNLREALAANGKANTRLICGLSWLSKRKIFGDSKSIALKDLAPVLDLPGIDYVDLQYGDTGSERQSLLASSGHGLRHVEIIDALRDIDGLASLIEACDVVLTISNTTAHLAGALGKKTLLMLPHSRGVFWYWGVREQTPWYPSVTIIRQQSAGHWGDVIERAQTALMSI